MINWLSDIKKAVHLDFHMPEFPCEAIKNFDAQRFVDNLVIGNVEVVTVFAKDHYGMSFYNTEVGHKHKGLKRDFLGEVTDAAHKKGIKVLAYLSICWDQHISSANQDWCQLDKKGERVDKGWPWGIVCINSPYKEESILPQVREICEHYPVDGFFFDIVMFQPDACFCVYCKEKFAREYRMPMLTNGMITDSKLHQEFMANSMLRFVDEARTIVKSFNSDAVICCNASWQMGQDGRILELADLGIIEAQPGHASVGGYNLLSWQCHYARTQGKPFEIVTVRFSSDWGEMSIKETEQLKYEFSVIAANGGIVCCGDQVYPDGTLEPVFYKRLRETFEYVDKRSEGFKKTTQVKNIAVFNPQKSSFPFTEGDFNHSLLGAHKAFTELHYQYDIIDYDTAAGMESYQVVILPAGAYPCTETVDRIREYVKNGGNLVSFYDSCLKPGTGFEIEDLLGIKYMECLNYNSAYIKLRNCCSEGNLSDIPDIPLLVKSNFLKIKPVTSEIMADLHYPLTYPVNPQRSFRCNYPPAKTDSHNPSITVNKYGKGKVVYVATDLFKAYWEWNHVWIKQIIGQVMKESVDYPPYMLDGYPNLEMNMSERDGTKYLHIVNYANNKVSWGGYPPIEYIPPVYNVGIKIRADEESKISVIPDGIVLDGVYSDGYMEVTVPCIDIYTVLKIENRFL